LCGLWGNAAGQSESTAPAHEETIVPKSVAPANWTGLYVGGNLGGSWASFDFGDTSEFFEISAFPFTIPGLTGTDSSFIVGGQIGYNQELGRLVLGLDCNINSISERTSKMAIFQVFPPPPSQALAELVTVRHSVETDLTATVNGRVGFAWQQLLFYATGGFAFADVTVRSNDLLTVPLCCGEIGAASDDGLAIGWAAGGGVEYSITRTISLGADYQHLHVGGDYNPGNQFFSARTHVGFTEDQVGLRVNVHFVAFFHH